MLLGRAWTIGLLALGWPALAADAPPSRAGGQPPSPQAAEEPQVQIKNLDRTSVIYLEHQGPYWKLGHLFAQVADFMTRHDQPGPLFGRYLDDPRKVELSRLRAEVGFIVSGDLQAAEPYQTKVLPPRTVAALVVRGHYGQTPAWHPTLFAWITEHGYLAEQAVTEIYPISPDGVPPTERTTEIQVTLLGAAGDGPIRPKQTEPRRRAPRSMDYKAFARRLVPLKAVFPESLRDWMAQVVLRIEAIRTAAAAHADGGKTALDVYAGPILARSGWLLEGTRASYDVEPPARASEAAIHRWRTEARRLLPRLDAVLVNVTLARIGPDEALDQLVKLTAWVPDLVEQASRSRPRR